MFPEVRHTEDEIRHTVPSADHGVGGEDEAAGSFGGSGHAAEYYSEPCGVKDSSDEELD